MSQHSCYSISPCLALTVPAGLLGLSVYNSSRFSNIHKQHRRRLETSSVFPSVAAQSSGCRSLKLRIAIPSSLKTFHTLSEQQADLFDAVSLAYLATSMLIRTTRSSDAATDCHLGMKIGTLPKISCVGKAAHIHLLPAPTVSGVVERVLKKSSRSLSNSTTSTTPGKMT